MSELALRMPSNYVEIDRAEMEYVDGGLYISNSNLYGILGSVLVSGSIATISGSLGAIELALSVICPPIAIGLAIGGAFFFADLPGAIYDAGMQGKGINFGIKYTWFGAPYQLKCDVQ
jgi:hypothetical protein